MKDVTVRHSPSITPDVMTMTMEQRVPMARRAAIGKSLGITNDDQVYQFLRLCYGAWKMEVGATRAEIALDDVEWALLQQLEIGNRAQLNRKKDAIKRTLSSLVNVRETRLSIPATNVGAHPVQPGSIRPVIIPQEENQMYYVDADTRAADVAEIIEEAAIGGATREQLASIAAAVSGEFVPRDPSERQVENLERDLRDIERSIERGGEPQPVPPKSPGSQRYRQARIESRLKTIRQDVVSTRQYFSKWKRPATDSSTATSNRISRNALDVGLVKAGDNNRWIYDLLRFRKGSMVTVAAQVIGEKLPRVIPESGLRRFLGLRQTARDLDRELARLRERHGEDANFLAKKLQDVGRSPLLGLDYRQLPNFFTDKDLDIVGLSPIELAEGIDIALMRGVLAYEGLREQRNDIDEAILQLVRGFNPLRAEGSLLGEADATAPATRQSIVIQGERDTNTPTEDNERVNTGGLSLTTLPPFAESTGGQPLGQDGDIIYAPSADAAFGEDRIVERHTADEFVAMDRVSVHNPEAEDAIRAQSTLVRTHVQQPTIRVNGIGTVRDFELDQETIQVSPSGDSPASVGSVHSVQRQYARHGRFASRSTGPVAGVSWQGGIRRETKNFRDQQDVPRDVYIDEGRFRGTRLRNFQPLYVERHVNNSNVISYDGIQDVLPDDWITTGMGNISFYDLGTQAAIGIGIKVYHIKIRMLLWRKDTGALDFRNVDMTGLMDLSTTSTTTTNIKRNQMLHEQTGDQTGVDETITSYMSVYTDIGGIHEGKTSRGNRTGIKTWVDTTNNKRRAIRTGSSAFDLDGEPPEFNIDIAAGTIGDIAWPRYEGTIIGTEEGVDLGAAAEVVTEKVVMDPKIPIVDHFIPTRTDIRAHKTNFPIRVDNNIISEMMGVMPTVVEANVISTTETSNVRVLEDDLGDNLTVKMSGQIPSPFFVAGEVQLRVVGWVLQDPSFLCDVDTQDQWYLQFGKIYVQGSYPEDSDVLAGEPRLVEVNVFQNYNFCVAGANPAEGANMNAEVFKEIDTHRINFTVMFDRLITVKTDSRSRLWTLEKTIEWITQERAELQHTFIGPGDVRHDVVAEGMRNRLVISYYPVPTVMPEGQFFNNWLGGTVVNFTSRWVYDRYIRENISRDMLPEVPLEQIVE